MFKLFSFRFCFFYLFVFKEPSSTAKWNFRRRFEKISFNFWTMKVKNLLDTFLIWLVYFWSFFMKKWTISTILSWFSWTFLGEKRFKALENRKNIFSLIWSLIVDDFLFLTIFIKIQIFFNMNESFFHQIFLNFRYKLLF